MEDMFLTSAQPIFDMGLLKDYVIAIIPLLPLDLLVAMMINVAMMDDLSPVMPTQIPAVPVL